MTAKPNKNEKIKKRTKIITLQHFHHKLYTHNQIKKIQKKIRNYNELIVKLLKYFDINKEKIKQNLLLTIINANMKFILLIAYV